MKLAVRTGLFALALIALPRASQAVVLECNVDAGVVDGTACVPTGQCIAAGKCDHGTCIATAYLPNGTGCVTNNACTVADHCQDGLCVPGAPVTCPADECHSATCDPMVGCISTEKQCDGGVDMTPNDAAVATTPEMEEQITTIGLGLGAGPSRSSCSFGGAASGELLFGVLVFGLLLVLTMRRLVDGFGKRSQ